MKSLIIAAVATAILSSPALADSAASTGHAATQPAGATGSATNMRQQVMSDLKQAGFSDIKVVPDSFLVQAKDKSGNPVTMMLNPGSVTEVVDVDNAAAGPSTPGGAGTFTTVPSADRVSSKIVGMDVHNKSNQDIGTIKDIAYDNGHIQAYILGVGGFLGVGDHYVAVRPSALTIAYDANAKSWKAKLDATADQLKAAPEYKYPSNS